MRISAARSIHRKLNLILVATVGLALLLAAVALLVVEARKEWQAAQRDLVTHADVIGLASEAALAFTDRKVGEQNLRVLGAKPGVLVAAIYDAGGQPFASMRFSGRDEAVPPAVRPPDGLEFDWFTASVVRPVISNREVIGSVYIRAQHGLLAELAEYIAWLIVVMLASLAGALLLARRMHRQLTGPIQDVSRVAQAVLDRGSFDVRATRSTNDEVGQLVDAFNAMLDELGRRAGVLQEANAALKASEARYQLAANGSSAGLWDWDMAAGTMYYSPRFKALLGYTEREFPDQPSSLMEIMHPDDKEAVVDALQAHLTANAPYQAECRLRERDGQWRWFLVTGMALKDPQGKAYRMAGSLIDIQQRKQSEILLQEANRAKDEFLATLAHELRNPLAPLRTGLQILKNPGAPAPTVQRTLQTMDRQLTHMVRLIDDLLDISRINSGKIRVELGRASLRTAIQTALELSRPALDAAGHALTVELPAGDIPLNADETRLAQAFGNLLNNAAKYTPPGGQVRLRAWQEDGTACVEVQDNGIGIPRDMLDQVFGLFAQVREGVERSPGGLGIGLFLVRSLIELHGGTVAADSPGPGQGTTFRVRLPCLPAQISPKPVEGVPMEQPSGQAPVRVLLVDDNVDAAETLATFLQMLGMETRTVHDGNAVQDAALAFRPDVVVLDIGLPGMDGYAVARVLRAHPELSRLLLIAVTGWGADDDRRKAMDAGFDHHLTKPVDVGVLEGMLRSVRQEQQT